MFFLCGKAGHGATRCPNLNEAFPFMLPSREGGRKLCYDIPQAGAKRSRAVKRRLIRGTGSTTRIWNGTRPQDPGGGEVQLAAFRDVAVARPILQPTPQPARVMVVTEELQRDMWIGLECDHSFREREAIGVSGTFHPVGAPTDALWHVGE